LVSGTRSVTYADLKDSNACSGYANISAVSSTNSGNNICWTFDAPAPNLSLLHYRWRIDHESEVSAGYYAAEDTVLTNRLYVGDRVRLRTTLSNTGTAAATDYNYRLEYASSSCTTWSPIGTQFEWGPDLTQYVRDYSSTTDSAGLTNPGGATWQSGVFRSFASSTGIYALPNAFFTEHEFSISSTAYVQKGVTYCFRLTNAGSISNFIYSVQPQLTIRSDARRETGGSSVEADGGGTPVTGGGPGGGSGSEGGGGGAPVGGGGQGGGGGLE